MIFYHGTTDFFKIKIIKPAQETCVLREEWRKKLTNKVFLTPSLMSAQKYAKKSAKKYGGDPIVYVTAPVGDIWNVNTNEYVADYAKILNTKTIYREGKWV